MNERPLTLRDPRRLRPTPAGFRCWEAVEDGDVGHVTFRCTVPDVDSDCNDDGHRQPLVFSCRGRSVGVLAGDEEAVDDADLDDALNGAVDPNFFDRGYTLAGRTGFQVWAGTRLLIESLVWPLTTSDGERLAWWQRRLVARGGGARVIELGCGIGVAGASLAAIGAEVLLTDLPTLVDNATRSNLILNSRRDDDDDKEEEQPGGGHRRPPMWLREADPVPIGHGWAGATALDWTRPVEGQLTSEQMEDVDAIVACDCVWLVSMLDGLLDVVASIFAAGSRRRRSPPSFLLCFQRRDAGEGDGSTMFTTVESVLGSVRARGWTVDCLSWRPATLDGRETEKEVFLFEIRPKDEDRT